MPRAAAALLLAAAAAVALGPPPALARTFVLPAPPRAFRPSPLSLARGGGRAAAADDGEVATTEETVGKDGPSTAVSPVLRFTSDALLPTFAAVTALHGAAFAFAPAFGSKFSPLIDEVEPGSVEEYCLEAAGCFVLELGITGYLAASGIAGPTRAIGYGMIPDLYFLLKNLGNGRFEKFGCKKLMTVLTAAGGACAANLFVEAWHPLTVVKVLTAMQGTKGLYSYFDPLGSGKRLLGTDLNENEKAKTLYRTSSMAKVISSFYRISLAFNVPPLRGLGYSMLLQGAMSLEGLLLRRAEKNAGLGLNLLHLVAGLAIGGVWVFAS